jgi:uncharacterized protein (TIGR03085 family)
VTYAQDERAALAALLEETGPDAPTLCAGWRTGDLAAHLVVRERRPDAAVGVAGGPLAGYTARLMRQYQERHSYPELVGLFRSGPPRLSPLAIPAADDVANTVEHFVHHEDVRRAGGDWPERPLGDGLSEVLWKRLKAARLFLRGAPAGVVLAREVVLPGDEGGKLDLIVAKGATRPGGVSVTVTGPPAELTLWSMGRVRAARVTLDGPDEYVAAVQKWRARGSG